MSEKVVLSPSPKMSAAEARDFLAWLRDMADDSILRLQLERHRPSRDGMIRSTYQGPA